MEQWHARGGPGSDRMNSKEKAVAGGVFGLIALWLIVSVL